MQEKNLQTAYESLRRIDVRHGNSFKGIKKFALFFQDKEVEIKSNAPSEIKAEYPNALQTQAELAQLKTELLSLQVQSWQEQYVGKPTLDDDEWQVSFAFKDGKTWDFVGVNAYPSTWQLVCALVYKYSGIQIMEREKTDE